MEEKPIYIGYMTSELIKQLEDKIATLIDGKGYGEITIVIKAHKIKWVSITETELVIHQPFE